jgi:hypothetical protein
VAPVALTVMSTETNRYCPLSPFGKSKKMYIVVASHLTRTRLTRCVQTTAKDDREAKSMFCCRTQCTNSCATLTEDPSSRLLFLRCTDWWCAKNVDSPLSLGRSLPTYRCFTGHFRRCRVHCRSNTESIEIIPALCIHEMPTTVSRT